MKKDIYEVFAEIMMACFMGGLVVFSTGFLIKSIIWVVSLIGGLL